LQRGDDGGASSSRQLPVGLRRFEHSWRGRLRLSLQLGPSRFLSESHPATGRGGNPALAGGCFRRGCWLSVATGEHCPEFGNLTGDAELLLLKTFDGGVDNFGGELVCGHVYSPVLCWMMPANWQVLVTSMALQTGFLQQSLP